MRADAFAKINLGLRVGSRREDGYHPVHGLFQSIGWSDRIWLEFCDEDVAETDSGDEILAGLGNFAWRAAVAVRDAAGSDRAMGLRLRKEIPVAAGLGGGSADAAAALGLAGLLFGVPSNDLENLAAGIGSDVPFCLRGGLALVEGRGEIVHPRRPAGGYTVGIVVPPIELATPAVFDRWDELGEPRGREIAASTLPPSRRGEESPANDLYPAAVSLSPALDDWRAEIEERWSRPVHMSGSGPALYGFFVDRDEAVEAVAIAPVGARAAHAAEPVWQGWSALGDETTDE